MKNILIISLILCSTVAHAQGVDKPEHGHPTHNMNVSNFARVIDKDNSLNVIEPEWIRIMQLQPIVSSEGIKTLDKIRMVNDKVNSKRSFALSPWLTPKQFYNAREADCKAYATTKYYELRSMGWKPEELNLWSGDYDGRPHLIVTARLNNNVYVLDIMNQNLPEAKDYFYKHFVPSYRFNEIGLDVN